MLVGSLSNCMQFFKTKNVRFCSFIRNYYEISLPTLNIIILPALAFVWIDLIVFVIARRQN